MRTDFGGAYDAMESRVRQLLDQLNTERRRDIDASDDMALARRSEQCAAWHDEIADIFEGAASLAASEGGHALEGLLACDAARLHSTRAMVHATVAKQHRERMARHYQQTKALRARVGNP